jgi:hypothetical protein
MQSTFISYGGPDEPFAKKLNEALKRNGVTTFLFCEDAVPGDRLHRMMHREVNRHDRVILICSRASLGRPGLQNELEQTLAREAKDGGREYLIPIRLDDYLFEGWKPDRPDLKEQVCNRVVADFRGAESDAKFGEALTRLLRALQKHPTPVV